MSGLLRPRGATSTTHKRLASTSCLASANPYTPLKSEEPMIGPAMIGPVDIVHAVHEVLQAAPRVDH